MENEKLNQGILNIWIDHFDEVKKFNNEKILWPVLSQEFNKNSILFLGINPSGDSDHAKDRFLIKNKDDIRDNDKIRELIDMEKKNIWDNGYSKYFKPFQKISNQLKISFDHFDLYFFRMRSSKKYFQLLEENKESQFFKKQLNLSLNTIVHNITPKVIFVANKEASDIFIKRFSSEIKFNELEGFYVLSINNHKIPVFFSGMISSARSIDNYTLDRIIWHIKKALNFYEVNNQ